MQQPGGGSQYGVPPSEMSPFSSPGAGPRPHVLSIDPLQQQQPPSTQPLGPPENASPLSSRPPMSSSASTTPRPQASTAFDELGPAVAGGFPDDDALAAAAGEEAERGAAAGNRWPRQETLALLKIRSEMDATFRDATLKGPLWEEVSRKLAELGYKRSAKKCKEKFENVHKYYKRTKDGRAGRQDGKSYRFFSQLEALHSSGGGAATPNAATVSPLPSASPASISFSAVMAGGPSGTRIQPSPISSLAPPTMAPASARLLAELTPVGGQHGVSGSVATAAAIAGLSYSTNSSSSSSSEESDDEVTEDAGGGQEGRKRKRSNGGSGRSKSSRKMMAFFEGLMKQVMERQEAMQQRFLETIEKREQDRMIREEAWRRQEMARVSREQEVLAQERTMAATRDNALISYLQKVTGQTIPISTAPAAAAAPNTVFATSLAPQTTFVPPPPQPELQPHQRSQPSQQKPNQKAAPMPVQPLQQQPPPPRQSAEVIEHRPSATELVAGSDPQDAGGASVSFETSTLSPSRWPKAEVHALIKLRSELDSRYQEAGPKGPLWEEISAGMQRLGYNRNPKRCKEKWENINKYFKKVKESNKKRPEDAKTCPYFHQLDALYRKKLARGSGGSSGVLPQQEQETDLYPERADATAPSQTSEQSQPSPAKPIMNGDSGGGNSDSIEGSGGVQTANGALPSSYFEEGTKKVSNAPTSYGPTTTSLPLLATEFFSSHIDISQSEYDPTVALKPEDLVNELMEQRRQQNVVDDYDKLDSDNMEQDDDEDDDDEDEDDEQSKMQYKIQYQRPQVNSSNGTGGSTSTATTTTAGSFVAMVQ